MSLTVEDTQRAISILKHIMGGLEESHSCDQESYPTHSDTNLQHLENVQDMLDRLESPLFSSLLEIHNRYKQTLDDPSSPKLRPQSVALQPSRQPELLPQIYQRYGVSDPGGAESIELSTFKQTPSPNRAREKPSKSTKSSGKKSKDLQSKSKAISSPGSSSSAQKNRMKKRSSIGVIGGIDLPNIASDSGQRTFKSQSLKKGTSADLSQGSPKIEGVEMSSLREAERSAWMVSSTESSLSSMSSEVVSHRSSPLPHTVTTLAAKQQLQAHSSQLVELTQAPESAEFDLSVGEKELIANVSEEEVVVAVVVTNERTESEEEEIKTSDVINERTDKGSDDRIEASDVLVIRNEKSESKEGNVANEEMKMADDSLVIENEGAKNNEEGNIKSAEPKMTKDALVVENERTESKEQNIKNAELKMAEDVLVIENERAVSKEKEMPWEEVKTSAIAVIADEKDATILTNKGARVSDGRRGSNDDSEEKLVMDQESLVIPNDAAKSEENSLLNDGGMNRDEEALVAEGENSTSYSISQRTSHGGTNHEELAEEFQEDLTGEKVDDITAGQNLNEMDVFNGNRMLSYHDNGDAVQTFRAEEGEAGFEYEGEENLRGRELYEEGEVRDEERTSEQEVGKSWESELEDQLEDDIFEYVEEKEDRNAILSGDLKHERRFRQQEHAVEDLMSEDSAAGGWHQNDRELVEDGLRFWMGEDSDTADADFGSMGEAWTSDSEVVRGDGVGGEVVRGDGVGSEVVRGREVDGEVVRGDEVKNKAEAAGPRDILFFMRDKGSQSELSKVLNRRLSREPRIVTLTLTEGTVGGASKAGLQLGGFTSTGVFVEAVLPGSEAAVEGQIQKADQLLKVNDIEIENMASFEVDLMLREAAAGDEMAFTFLYNPIGFAEYQRHRRKD